ncbi:MAG: glycerol-3-phosphate dehydrogenase/oxidase [Cyanobacteria bacterium J06632_3]
MQRNLSALANQSFDLLVIGGGMHGACVAWDATLRGLSVALVEQSDFASATSTNSLKVIHGGLRYLQNADFKRMRQSIKARQTLMRIAPHLVHPLPVMVPTYGHGIKGREAMAVAMKVNDLISCDRNLTLADPQKHIPAGELLSKSACLEVLPDLPAEGLTGAARFYDAQVYNSEQLVLSFIQSAVQRGAKAANYTRVTGFETHNGKVTAATVTDQLTGDTFPIQASTIINTSGPWVGTLIAEATGHKVTPPPLAKAMNLVTRPLFSDQNDCAVGITSRAPGSRLFFIAPWRQGNPDGTHTPSQARSLVGTWYGPDTTKSKPPSVDTDEVQGFLNEVSQAYPAFHLTPQDVEWVHVGLLPSYGVDAKTGEVQLTKHFQLQDHKADGFDGLLSVTGVKYTTALDIAQKVIDWAFKKRNESAPRSTANTEPLQGGQIKQFTPFLQAAIREHAHISPDIVQQLVYNYGSDYTNVLKHTEAKSDVLPADVLAAEVKYHLAQTMPQTLSDMVFRRTELGAAGHPGNDALILCNQIMAKALHWDDDQQAAELSAVQARFRSATGRSETGRAETSRSETGKSENEPSASNHGVTHGKVTPTNIPQQAQPVA